MPFNGKEISALSDEELWAAIQSVADMDNFRFDKLQDGRIKRKGHRLNKIFASNPPNENETFTNLVSSLQLEYQNRINKNVPQD